MSSSTTSENNATSSNDMMNGRKTWEGCSLLLDINDGDRLVFPRLSNDASKLKIGNKNYSLQPLIGCAFGSVFQAESGPQCTFLSHSLPSSLQGNNTEEIKDGQVIVESRDIRALIDNNTAQSLTGDDIEAMRRQGARGNEIIEALIANSATFETKTSFSQEKYTQETEEICPKSSYEAFLRVDTLSLLLSMANVSSNSDVLVVDMVGGLITGAVAERLGGIDFVCNSYIGKSPYSMDIVRIFNFSDEICKRSPISNLLSQKESLEQILQDANVCNVESQSNDQMGASVSMEEICNSSENVISDLGAEKTDNTNIPAKRVCKAAKAGEKAPQEIIDSWKENGFSSLIIAAPEMDTWTLVKDLLPLISNSAPFAIYHQYLQLEKMAIGLQILEPWLL
ncbi:hypothetical protein RIF29_16315 [Crotalaria pallida]|uniref:tRNA (adenine(58)-N(1))-methyltransferase non-catalytic subunit TRM6 n=1 Tax=Crotalaria pallida TaxID=3830 RepID=A0AAN9FIN5_CROPI